MLSVVSQRHGKFVPHKKKSMPCVASQDVVGSNFLQYVSASRWLRGYNSYNGLG